MSLFDMMSSFRRVGIHMLHCTNLRVSQALDEERDWVGVGMVVVEVEEGEDSKISQRWIMS
jgi:hypothetical protein